MMLLRIQRSNLVYSRINIINLIYNKKDCRFLRNNSMICSPFVISDTLAGREMKLSEYWTDEHSDIRVGCVIAASEYFGEFNVSCTGVVPGMKYILSTTFGRRDKY